MQDAGAPQDQSSNQSDDHVVAERASRVVSGGPGARIRRTMFKLPATREQVPATEASEAELSAVTAEIVLLDRSGAERITAERVSMERSGAQTIDAKSAQLERSGVVALGSDHSVLLHSSAVQVVAEEARISRSRILWLSSTRATLDGSSVLFFSGSADGDVRATFTPRTAMIFGAACGLALVVARALVNGVTRRT